MSKAPKVFVVPELMSNEPAEAGGLLKEYLAAERVRAPASVRERIQAYLQDPGVARKPAAVEWPDDADWRRMSSVERQRWLTWDAQRWVDGSLKKILGGKPPREVFNVGAKKRERPTTAARDRNICAEVLRLVERCNCSRSEAVVRVAKGFGVSEQLVERAAELWSWDAPGKKERRRFVPFWEHKLRIAGKLE